MGVRRVSGIKRKVSTASRKTLGPRKTNMSFISAKFAKIFEEPSLFGSSRRGTVREDTGRAPSQTEEVVQGENVAHWQA